MVGLFTRIAALLGSGAMAFAYFTEHQPHGLFPIQNGGEMAVLRHVIIPSASSWVIAGLKVSVSTPGFIWGPPNWRRFAACSRLCCSTH